jgi:hypothetical protein
MYLCFEESIFRSPFYWQEMALHLHVVLAVQSAQKCGSNFYTKCHKMALSKSQICSILQHSIFEFFEKNMLRRFFEQFLPPICVLKFVEMLLEACSYALSIMVVNFYLNLNVLRLTILDIYISQFR